MINRLTSLEDLQPRADEGINRLFVFIMKNPQRDGLDGFLTNFMRLKIPIFLSKNGGKLTDSNLVQA